MVFFFFGTASFPHLAGLLASRCFGLAGFGVLSAQAFSATPMPMVAPMMKIGNVLPRNTSLLRGLGWCKRSTTRKRRISMQINCLQDVPKLRKTWSLSPNSVSQTGEANGPPVMQIMRRMTTIRRTKPYRLARTVPNV